MRPTPERRFYTKDGASIIHAKPGTEPQGAREITAAEAAAIKAARPRPVLHAVPAAVGDATAVVDLGPVIDELARLHARCDAQEAATADINKVLDSVEIERLEGIEVKS